MFFECDSEKHYKKTTDLLRTKTKKVTRYFETASQTDRILYEFESTQKGLRLIYLF